MNLSDTLKTRLIQGLVAIIIAPAVVGILGGVLQLFEILSTKATSWLISCIMLSLFTTFLLIGIVAPIVFLVLFISQVRDKEDPNRSPVFAFIYLVVMGGGLGFGAYHCFFQIPIMYSRFLDGFSTFLF